jgi:acetolactate synthase-1/2/3 large subunit
MTTPVAATNSVLVRRASGAFALIDSLRRHGVEHIFGYPGGAILPIYDELYRAEAAGGISHI